MYMAPPAVLCEREEPEVIDQPQTRFGDIPCIKAYAQMDQSPDVEELRALWEGQQKHPTRSHRGSRPGIGARKRSWLFNTGTTPTFVTGEC